MQKRFTENFPLAFGPPILSFFQFFMTIFFPFFLISSEQQIDGDPGGRQHPVHVHLDLRPLPELQQRLDHAHRECRSGRINGLRRRRRRFAVVDTPVILAVRDREDEAGRGPRSGREEEGGRQ